MSIYLYICPHCHKRALMSFEQAYWSGKSTVKKDNYGIVKYDVKQTIVTNSSGDETVVDEEKKPVYGNYTIYETHLTPTAKLCGSPPKEPKTCRGEACGCMITIAIAVGLFSYFIHTHTFNGVSADNFARLINGWFNITGVLCFPFIIYILMSTLMYKFKMKSYKEACQKYDNSYICSNCDKKVFIQEGKKGQSDFFFIQANEFFQKQMYEEALELYTDAIKNYDNSECYYGRAFVYCKLNDYDKAINEINYAIDKYRKNSEYYFFRGTCYSDIKRYSEAINDFTQAISLKPDNGIYYYRLGLVYSNINDYHKAIECYEKSIALEYFCYGMIGSAYEKLKDYEKAIFYYSKNLEIFPDSHESYFYRGLMYHFVKKFNESVKDYTHAIELCPNNSEYYFERGHSYSWLHDHNNQIKDYKKAIELNPNVAEYYYSLAVEYCDLKDYTTALEYCKSSIQLDNNQAKYYYMRGKCFEAFNEIKKAELDYKKAVSLSNEKYLMDALNAIQNKIE